MSDNVTETLLNTLKQTHKTAHADLDTLPAAVQAGHRIAKAEAKDALPGARQRYQDRLFSNVVFLCPTGPKDKQLEFAASAQQEGATFTVDVDQAYECISTPIGPTMGRSREFGYTQVAKMHDAIENLLPNQTWATPRIYELAVTPTDVDLVEYVRQLCGRIYGPAVSFAYVLDNLTAQALSRDFTDRTLGAVIMGWDEALLAALQSRAEKFRVKHVALTPETAINKSFTMSVFRDAKANAKKSS